MILLSIGKILFLVKEVGPFCLFSIIFVGGSGHKTREKEPAVHRKQRNKREREVNEKKNQRQ